MLKELFSVHGIPDVVISDNALQFSSQTFTEFAKTYGFIHTTSSPRYPQANGEAERAVRMAKVMLKKNADPYLALLSYRATPLQNGLSPSELLMGRRLKTQLPVLPSTLKPMCTDPNLLRAEVKEQMYRANQQQSFNNKHKPVPILGVNTSCLQNQEGLLKLDHQVGSLKVQLFQARP